MTNAAVANPKCLFGRSHTWMTRGAAVCGRTVHLCTTCGLVEGTGTKIDVTVGGGLFTADSVVARHFRPGGRLTPHQADTLTRLVKWHKRTNRMVALADFGSRGAIHHLSSKGEVVVITKRGPRGGEHEYAEPVYSPEFKATL